MNLYDEQNFYDNLHDMNKLYNDIRGYVSIKQIPKYEEFNYIIETYLELRFDIDITKLSLNLKNFMCDLISNTYKRIELINKKIITDNSRGEVNDVLIGNVIALLLFGWLIDVAGKVFENSNVKLNIRILRSMSFERYKMLIDSDTKEEEKK